MGMGGLVVFANAYKYIIVGGGLAGGSAVSGIRESDGEGSILLLCKENVLPYERPPISKKVWFDKKRIEDVFVKDGEFYLQKGVDVGLGMSVAAVDPVGKMVTDDADNTYRYEKLLLATGGTPRTLDIPGADAWDLCYYRYLNDYLRMRRGAGESRTALVIGGGFIGSEMAAALNLNKVAVTMVYPEPYLVQRVFPEGLGMHLQQLYIDRGIRIMSRDVPASVEKRDGRFATTMKSGQTVESDILIVGVGIAPDVSLAEAAGLEVGNGVIVNEFLQTSNPDVYAAGDLAFLPYKALGDSRRIEHWDNALNQGTHAGRNMAGAGTPFEYMPYFFSDLFEFGYEAVGDVNSKLDVFADWQKENDTGVLYYLKDNRVRGVMTCNIYDKQDAARELIRKGEQVDPESLRGAIG